MLEEHFIKFRQGIIGIDSTIQTPYKNNMPIIYADWTASGRNYLPIEKRIQESIMPYIANTHTENSSTGKIITEIYDLARITIKKHINALKDDVIITSDSGMTGVINKLQRILGLRNNLNNIHKKNIPIVFITHMEHHSNQLSWLESIADVEIIKPNKDGLPDLSHFKDLIHKYRFRKIKIASVTACSNFTGIINPLNDIAKIIHSANGYCFVDYACSAPYVNIDMHPKEKGTHLDAVFFSSHKFLGGPGSCGVLVFNKSLYNNIVPDNPGGGVVEWSNPWKERRYFLDIEKREDSGTPCILQTIKAAMCFNLKKEMGLKKIQKREDYLVKLFLQEISKISNIVVLESNNLNRIAIFSFNIKGLHYNLVANILNDRFGIQCRTGCFCAGTYAHYVMNIDANESRQITNMIDKGDSSIKPGWVRLSLHPVMTDAEVLFIIDSIKAIAKNHNIWSKDYSLDIKSSNYFPNTDKNSLQQSYKLNSEKILTQKFV